MKDQPVCPNCGSTQIEYRYAMVHHQTVEEAEFEENGRFQRNTETTELSPGYLYLGDNSVEGWSCGNCDREFDEPLPASEVTDD